MGRTRNGHAVTARSSRSAGRRCRRVVGGWGTVRVRGSVGSFYDSWPPCEHAHRDAGVCHSSTSLAQPVSLFPQAPVGARPAFRVATRSQLSQRARRLRGAGGGDRCSSEPTGIQSREGPGVSWGGGCESLQSSLSHRGVRQRTVTSLVVGWGEGGEGRQQGPHVGSPKSGGPNRCTITCSAQAVTPQVTRYCHVPCRPRLLSHILSLPSASTRSRRW